MKNLAFITTHVINKAVISEYQKMCRVEGVDTILAIDNTKLKMETNGAIEEKEFFDIKVKCFFFDEQLNQQLNLPEYYSVRKVKNFAEVQWYHSDYRFYYVKKVLPDYDYYWQFEYDVFCNGDSYSEFFKKYMNFEEDLLICGLRPEPINGEWYWSNEVEWAYSEIFASFFPVSRVSSRAIDFLYKKRIERFEQYLSLENKEKSRWLFCEVFVPTELITGGYTTRSINEKFISFANWDKEFDLNEDRLFEHPDNLLYHPIKGQFINRVNKLMKENKSLKKRIKKLETETKNKNFWDRLFPAKK